MAVSPSLSHFSQGKERMQRTIKVYQKVSQACSQDFQKGGLYAQHIQKTTWSFYKQL